MKKKIFLIISMCLVLMFGLSACGETDPTTVDYNGYSYDDLKSGAQNTVTTLMKLSDEEKAYYLSMGDEALTNLITRWDEACEGVGEFVGLEEFDIVKSGKTLTVEQTVQFEKRPVIVSFVYNYHTMEQTDVAIDPVQTFGEKMSNAGMNTIMGIGTVFVVLILICLIIYAFKLIPYFMDRKKKEEPVAQTSSPAVEQAVAVENVQDDLELVAVISAAIAAATGTSADGFVVRSIKRR